ncbi:ASST-domain-containing protein [Xylariaceae sp. FL0016]|nr:ASST-domain-containing protein [Xylariaceae sp. FL0016]
MLLIMYGISFVSTTTIVAFFYVYSLFVNPVAADLPLHTHLQSFQAGELGQQPNQTFFSSPIKAPIYQVNHFDHDKVDQTPYIFITGGLAGFGPSIISSKDLSLIWADQQYETSQAHRTYMFLGQPVLGVFAGDAVRIYNQQYEFIYRVVPQGDLAGTSPDSHEALLTRDSTVAMIVSRAEDFDLSSIGRPGIEKATNCYAQEVDPVTNEVKWQFSVRDYFRVEDSYLPYNGDGPYHFDIPYDVWHMNSIEKTEDGDFLISIRHLHSIILVDGKTAQVKWVLGGKRSDFEDVTGGNRSAVFHWQHNARLTAPNRMTLFDNQDIFNRYCKEEQCSRGLEIEFNNITMEYKVVNEWYHPQGLISASRGGTQRTPGGNVLVAWGQNPMYTEYTSDGELVMDVQRGQVLEMDHGVPPVIAYRAWKADWVGKPKWPPSIATRRDKSGAYVFVSWNGATDVDKWILLLADHIDGLNGKDHVTAKSNRTGFETAFLVVTNQTYARIAALDVNGTILGFTSAVNLINGNQTDPGYPVDDLVTSARAEMLYEAQRGDVPAAAFAAISFAVFFTIIFAVMSIRKSPFYHSLLGDEQEQERLLATKAYHNYNIRDSVDWERWSQYPCVLLVRFARRMKRFVG